MSQRPPVLADMPLDKIRLLAQQLKKKSADTSIPRLPRDTNRFPLSVSQERFWLQSRIDPASNAYNYSCAVRLKMELQLAHVQRALDDLHRRHESLRTVFSMHGGEPVQVVRDFASRPLDVIDLRALPAGEREEEALRLAGEHSTRPFDLTTGPLLRTLVVQLTDRETLFVATVHHAVCDGWCLDVLIREFAGTYAAFLRGLPAPFPEPRLQYADYASWQRQQLSGASFEPLARYWRETLDGLETLRLPVDRPRPAVQTFRGGCVRMNVGSTTASALRQLARAEGATSFMVTFAAFAALLHRYAGQDDVTIGTPFGARNRKELEGVIGDFTNLLVLRADCGGDPTFRELLARAKECCLSAFRHEGMPFEKLVELLHPERDTSRNPLVQVAFQLESSAGMSAFGNDLGTMPIEPFALETAITRFDIEVHLWDGLEGFLKRGASLAEGQSADGLFGNVLYNAELFERATVERFAHHYAALLAAAAANPDTRLSRLQLLSAGDEALLTRWSAGLRTGPAELVHRRIEAHARRNPGATALISNGTRVSYGQLNARANRLARKLRREGVGRDVIAGVAMERSIERTIAVLAIWKAGGAYVPLDTGYPAERLALMLDETNAPVVLADAAAELPPSRARVLRIAEEETALADEEASDLEVSVNASDLAYVIYTSGSTGTPKGVLTEHGALANLTGWHLRAFDVTPEDRATQLTSFSFDGSIWETWPYLAAGAALEIVPEDALASAGRFIAWLAAARTTIAFLPTALCVPLLPALEQAPPGTFALRLLLTGGDKLPRAPHAGAAFRLVNNYGPTENGVVATWSDVRPGTSTAPAIGRPIDNVDVHVLDPHGERVPPGVAGELFIGGASLARGYLARPELDAERFTTHCGQRMYRTGDLVRWAAAGEAGAELEFLGRADQQVKIRCFRIELGEIETALASLEGVSDCAVAVRDDEHGEKRIVAWAVATLDAAAIREALRQRLPEFMLPSAVVLLPSLPLTRNGKVDRNALPAPATSAPPPQPVEHVPPRTELERIIAAAWSEALGVERVGIHDNFFDLGGHSLLLIRVSTLLSRTLDRDLSAINLFDYTTVASLAAYLSETTPARVAPAEPSTAAVDRRDAMQRQRQRRMESRV